jgi:hypothetical protein
MLSHHVLVNEVSFLREGARGISMELARHIFFFFLPALKGLVRRKKHLEYLYKKYLETIAWVNQISFLMAVIR